MRPQAALVHPIIAALVAAMAPHAPGLPLWINAWCLVMWGYLLVGLKKDWPLPNARVLYFLAFAGILGLMLTYRVQLGSDAFVGLLALMAAIKPFEMPNHRHQMITVLLTYFIIITSLFRSESMFIVGYMFFSVFVTTLALVRVNDPQGRFGESLKLSGTILAQAIPLMVILFLLFPRLPGSLFGIQDKTRALSGFSDRMSPGTVSQLIQNQALAFRVEFDGPVPLADPLYWRGITFEKFDGASWTIDDAMKPPLPPPVVQAEDLGYTILLEPHHSPWLPALDLPVQGPPWANLRADHTLKAPRPIKQRTKYKALSRVGNSDKKMIVGKTPENQDLPSLEAMAKAIIESSGTKNPRARALAEKIAGSGSSASEKAALLMAHFRENPFVYTLTPPLAGPHPIDSLLFESRQGYCEHYASAFAFMMNVLGVPARVVGGYLGGEYNPLGDYLVIRHSYAHAWTEIFDPDQGWVRQDPTLAVALDRLQTNPDGTSAPVLALSAAMGFARQLRFALDAANLRWEAWFTGYSYFEQKAWLERLGLGKGSGFTQTAGVLVLLTLLALALFSGLVWFLLPRKKQAPDPVEKAYVLFCQRLARQGLVKAPGQGPVDFARASAQKRPDLHFQISAITHLYVQLRFAKSCPVSALAGFQNQVKTFKPKPVKDTPL